LHVPDNDAFKVLVLMMGILRASRLVVCGAHTFSAAFLVASVAIPMAAAAMGWIFAAEVAPAEVSEVERVCASLLVVSAILVVDLFLVGSDGGGEGCVEMVEMQFGSSFPCRALWVVCGGKE
jgi:hypothetical protein